MPRIWCVRVLRRWHSTVAYIKLWGIQTLSPESKGIQLILALNFVLSGYSPARRQAVTHFHREFSTCRACVLGRLLLIDVWP